MLLVTPGEIRWSDGEMELLSDMRDLISVHDCSWLFILKGCATCLLSSRLLRSSAMRLFSI